MVTTARKHFNEDIKRANDILHLSWYNLDFEGITFDHRRDIRLMAIAMAVGAMDAYFKDKYVDCVTSVLKSYANNRWMNDFSKSYLKLSLPAGEVLNSSRKRIRNAVSKLMEKESMYDISELPKYFNPILSKEAQLWDTKIEDFIKLNWKRFTGIRWDEYNILNGDKRKKARQRAVGHLKKRLITTVKIRHDLIHNCGRPNLAINDLTQDGAIARIREIKVFVTQIDDHIENHRLDRRQ